MEATIDAHSFRDWKEVDRQLRRLAKARAAHDYEEGHWLLAARRTAAHVHFGCASLAEYVERVLGYDPRATGERLRVAEALESLPATASALRDGAITWSTARELTRVAAPKTERDWLAAAAGRTVREIETMVAGRRPGDRPADPKDPALVTQVIRLELRPEALALFREAVGWLRRNVDAQLSDEDAIAEMARAILRGPTDEGRSAYQVALTVCERCGDAKQQARGETVAVENDVAERAACDAQHVGDAHVGTSRATQTIPPATRRLVVRRANGRCQVPGCRGSNWLEVHHILPRSEGGTHDPDGLVLLCGAHHRLHHRGFLLIEGSASVGMRFRHADGTGGEVVSADEAEVHSQAFAVLRELGVRDGEAKRLLAVARTQVGAGAGLESLVRAALATLRPGASPAPAPPVRTYVVHDTHVGGAHEPEDVYGDVAA